ncbi:response regulator [Candidatus Methylacidithermus pantelleriae]|uniref:Response regulatory domain-containing protein n=1 Tax=Candidatus Methylacidithermus pantelleriae TaxID=2744239 RepID=A0A8J2BPP6_9BACT|nr:response regulator [Candidatus Methylacidithermus pantelleriae]CAF0699929.1 hypothetical protein MPNT_310014 [Candidatus Methylacidithermus pantelleriae]
MDPVRPIPSSPASRWILFVEDERGVRWLLRLILEKEAYHCEEATNAQEGLLQTAQFRPDLVLLDLGLPDLDGMQLVKPIREWSRLPMMIVTVAGPRRRNDSTIGPWCR